MGDIFSGFINKVIGENKETNSISSKFAKNDQKSFKARLAEISGELNRDDAATFYNDPFIRTEQKDGFA